MKFDEEGYQWILEYPQVDVLRALWRASVSDKADTVIWRQPETGTLHFLADFSMQRSTGYLQLETSTPGFAVSPFNNPEGQATRLLQPDVHVCFQTDGKRVICVNKVDDSFWQRAADYKDDKQPLPFYEQETAGQKVQDPDGISGSDDSAHFMSMVEKARHAIESRVLEKVVLARTLTLPLPEPLDLIELFQRLANSQQDAFASLVSLPGHGTWMGASPELLVETDQNNCFRTESLAGTQACSPAVNLSQVRWRQKEIEEQAMVSRYIVEQFKTLRLREFVENGPVCVRAGSMFHLKTSYQVDMEAIGRPDVASQMLQLLHPTSAVCGLPKQAAQQFIEQNEGMQRGLYCGYLGPVNMHGKTRLYVNIRCMQIQRRKLVFMPAVV